MPVLTLNSHGARKPAWLPVIASGGLAWNLFGAFQFVGAISATADSLAAAGLTDDQIAVMTGYPLWMTLAFATGVAGGLAGSALLLLRKDQARPVLGLSLLAYVALWIGDAIHGVFAAMGASQLVILNVVVAIAALLYAASRHPAARA